MGYHELSLKVLPSVCILYLKGVLQENEEEARTLSYIRTRECSGPLRLSPGRALPTETPRVGRRARGSPKFGRDQRMLTEPLFLDEVKPQGQRSPQR